MTKETTDLTGVQLWDRLYDAQHFMFDFETLGLNPVNNPIIEIGIVNFQLKYNTYNAISRTFQQAVKPWEGAEEDPKTIEWHLADPVRAEHYTYLRDSGTDPAVGFGWAIDWIEAICNGKEGYFWAKPAQFDWSFWCSHLETFSLTNPFHRRNVIDVRSFVSGLVMSGGKLLPQVTDKWFAVSSHKALEDATLQVGLIHQAMGFVT